MPSSRETSFLIAGRRASTIALRQSHILAGILNIAVADSGYQDRSALLACASLVCRTWHAEAKQLLWKEVSLSIGPGPSGGRLLQTIVAHPDLCTATERARFVLQHDGVSPVANSEAVTVMSWLHQLLPQMSRLHTLGIEDRTLPNDEPITSGHLCLEYASLAPHMSHITQLSLAGVPCARPFWDLLRPLRNLKALELLDCLRCGSAEMDEAEALVHLPLETLLVSTQSTAEFFTEIVFLERLLPAVQNSIVNLALNGFLTASLDEVLPALIMPKLHTVHLLDLAGAIEGVTLPRPSDALHISFGDESEWSLAMLHSIEQFSSRRPVPNRFHFSGNDSILERSERSHLATFFMHVKPLLEVRGVLTVVTCHDRTIGAPVPVNEVYEGTENDF